MLAWIFLILLVLFPWVAPTLERACSRYAGFVQPDEPNAIGTAFSEGFRDTTGHLRRAKAEGAG